MIEIASHICGSSIQSAGNPIDLRTGKHSWAGIRVFYSLHKNEHSSSHRNRGKNMMAAVVIAMRGQPIASVEFENSVSRPVYEDSHRQYVLDDEGEPIFGV